MSRVGDRIHAAAPMNEPWCVAWLSHFLGQHAPGLRDIRAAARAKHHVMLAHGRAVETMRGLGMGNLGAVMNFEFATPADDSPEANAAAGLYHAIYNRWFVEGAVQGRYPEEALAGLEAHMPNGRRDDLAVIAVPVDWLGINYYTRKLIAPDPGLLWPSLREIPGPPPKTDMDWEIYPDGLQHFLTWLHETAAPGLPLYVTENGMAASAPQQDGDRIAHLAAARRAMETGVPLKGYFVWSLLDNYEWALGYEKRFGLVYVDLRRWSGGRRRAGAR